MTITTALILLIVTIVGVGVALAGVIIPANNRLAGQVNQDIAGLRQEINGLRQEINGLRQEMNQDIAGLRQEINQVSREVGHLAGLLEGLRGRPIVTEQPEEMRA